MGVALDLIGQQFGRLTVVAHGDTLRSPSGKPRRTWNCTCSCGGVAAVVTEKLTSGHTQSCGCLQRERTGNANRKHGKTRTQVYRTWCNMLSRCGDAINTSTLHYGQRGIRVCNRWQESFENFYADMGDPPTPKHSIERNDSNGHYEPGNCRWATKVEQVNNTSRNRYLEFNGERLTVPQWAQRVGISPKAIHDRLLMGWSVERALTQKPNPKRQAAGVRSQCR